MRQGMGIRKIIVLMGVFTMIVALPSSGYGEVPQRINCQGYLTDDMGSPLDGDYSMTFTIYTTAGGDTDLWTETQTVPVANGIYNVQIGQDPAGNPFPEDLFDGQRWLGVAVGMDPEMTPRQLLTSTPYAMRSAMADDADTLDGMDASAFGDITGVSAGTGLSGGGTTGTVTVSASFAGSGSATTIARSDHNHDFSNLSGTASDAQIPNDITVNYAATAKDADTLDGSHASAFAQAFHNHSAANITSGTLNTSRYSAYTDLSAEGYLADASGDIARNNGIRQVNLNADMVDGNHAASFINTSATAQTKVGEFTADASAVEGSQGVRGIGESMGGYFETSNGSGYAYVGRGNVGVWGFGSYAGGSFDDITGSGFAYIAVDDTGIYAFGDTEGGYFYDDSDSGEAHVGYGNRGIWAKGLFAGGTFSHPDDITYWADVSTSTHKIEGTGAVSFVQNHPYEEDTVIVYTAAEGDEVAVYTRGKARLVDGVARVTLSETFQYVANPDIGLTAHITPRGKLPVPLSVASLNTSEMIVHGPDGSDTAFDYLVYGLRLGFEEMAVVQQKERDALLPAAEAIEAAYGDRPDLRAFNAMARYRQMHATVSNGTDIDLSRSQKLVAALEGQRIEAIARATALQETILEENQRTDDAIYQQAVENSIDPTGREAGFGAATETSSIATHQLIAELRAEIEVLKVAIMAMQSSK